MPTAEGHGDFLIEKCVHDVIPQFFMIYMRTNTMNILMMNNYGMFILNPWNSRHFSQYRIDWLSLEAIVKPGKFRGHFVIGTQSCRNHQSRSARFVRARSIDSMPSCQPFESDAFELALRMITKVLRLIRSVTWRLSVIHPTNI